MLLLHGHVRVATATFARTGPQLWGCDLVTGLRPIQRRPRQAVCECAPLSQTELHLRECVPPTREHFLPSSRQSAKLDRLGTPVGVVGSPLEAPFKTAELEKAPSEMHVRRWSRLPRF